MDAVFLKHDTDKSSKFHNYTAYYEKYLKPFTGKAGLRYLEIGVYRGGSLRAFREYFPLAERIVGIDINGGAKASEDASQHIYVEIGDQSDPDFLKYVTEKHGPFDVILDDGSHQYEHILASFTCLFPLLANEGVYIVEDSICIRDQLQFFHSLTRYLHKWGRDIGGDYCVDPEKFAPYKTTDPLEYGVGDIVFTNSAILINKHLQKHWM